MPEGEVEGQPKSSLAKGRREMPPAGEQRSDQSNAQQSAPGRWALGIADVGVQGAKPGRGVESDPNSYAASAMHLQNQQQQEQQQDTPMASPDAAMGQRLSGVTSSAATLLMAASTLAQMPTQHVSDALLGKAQSEAAEEHIRRRSSVPGLALQDASQLNMQKGFTDGSIAMEPQQSANRIGDSDAAPPTLSIDATFAGLSSASVPSSSASFGASVVPQSPRSLAAFQVGTIAAKVAANEYVEQVYNNGNVDTTSLHSSRSLAQRRLEPQAANHGVWNPQNPFQGVPSLPLTPSASLAMIPPPNLSSSMITPLSPGGSAPGYFRPTYRLEANEYEILASAAAVATVALTTASASVRPDEADSSPSSTTPVEASLAAGQGRNSRHLTSEEKEEIASTLRAWAGLEGVEKQEEARTKLQQRQTQLSDSLNHGETDFFPPDFARHYRAQLTALAAGYYQKLHSEGVTQSQWAPTASGSQIDQETDKSQRLRTDRQPQPETAFAASQQRGTAQTSGSFTTASLLANTGTTTEDFQKLQKNALEAKKQAAVIAAARKQMRQQSEQDAAMQHEGDTAQECSSLPQTIPTDPIKLIAQASSAAGLDVTSPQIRDHLLQYAHSLYSNAEAAKAKVGTSNGTEQGQATAQIHPTLLPLLHTLHNLHPHHLPILLLLSCAYFVSGDLSASLWYNKIILQTDTNYVESMSNVGTTLRALGRWKEAESWWWKALKLRPEYWDAFENLLGVLCSPQQPTAVDGQSNETKSTEVDQQSTKTADQVSPRFTEALKLCEHVETHVMTLWQSKEGDSRARKVPGGDNRPICMPPNIPTMQASRLQNLFYAKGNLKFVLQEYGPVPAAREYQKAIEMMLSSSEQSAYSLRDLVMATYAVGVLTMGVSLPGAYAGNAANEIAQAIGLDPNNPQQAQLAASGQFSNLSSGGILRMVRDAGDSLVHLLLRLGGGHLPMLMLLPNSSVTLCKTLFGESDGGLPAIVSIAHSQRASNSAAAGKQALQQASSMSSTILLTLSKLYQDGTASVTVGPHGPLTLGGIPLSISLLFPFYYLSLSLHPSASTANNLGILLSSIPAAASVINNNGQRQQMNGQSMALQYYTFGLQLDPKHPHLYTNFGSLLKDLNHLTEAIQMYEKAIECNPQFDVALANLGNAIKDQGRTQESVPYYRRAVKVNPDFPEALCGLVNALLAVCDWKEVYGDDDENGTSGYLKRLKNLLDRQLEDGCLYGARSLSTEGTVDDWVDLVSRSSGDERDTYKAYLRDKFAFFYDDTLNRKASKINEGSFVIRLIERLLRRSQRRWYIDAFVQGGTEDSKRIEPQEADIKKYCRIPLPSCLVSPAVPTVLPFHTFTLKIPPRHIRLISHRNALRISQATLTQPWLPSHVFPPPPPPRPKLRVGYISSDFNNHPLAHLMQSVFGFHNLDDFDIFLYATTASDQSPYRLKIEKEAQHFIDVTSWSNADVINRILQDEIHILMNLNGYTKGARNEIFAARPCPVQMEFMGFAGSLASGWTDWMVVDPIVCPPEVTSTDHWRARKDRVLKPTDWKGDLDPEEESNDWMYTEKLIYMPDSYFVNDHRQGFREPREREAADGTHRVKPYEMNDEEAWQEEEERRWKARKEMWPNIPDDYVIFSDFNQLYKLEPTLFKLWLRILQRVPNSILWLLRFPAAGESHLLDYAKEKFGAQVASRVIFTEVAPKGVHIHRGRIADLFLDTLECGAHTTSADILWSATPVLTWPKHKHKMASRVAASIVNATGFGQEMIAQSEKEYEDRAVKLAKGINYIYVDEKGERLSPLQRKGSIQADALEINTQSSSALRHSQPVQQPSSGAETTSSASIQPATSGEELPKGTAADPAPANVKQAAVENRAEGSEETSSSSVTSKRHEVTLPYTGEQAPPGTVSRRAQGTLAELRKRLFLTRDQNRLFDTRRWTSNLERGYKEAWSRFVDGTDTEESVEWEQLPPDDERKKSGHIWL